MAGLWSHRDVAHFSFIDLLDAHEILDTKEANAASYAQWKAAQEGK